MNCRPPAWARRTSGSASPYLPLRGPLLTTWKALIANTGDELSRPMIRSQGSKANHNYWSVRGFNSKSPRYCNTFGSAPERSN